MSTVKSCEKDLTKAKADAEKWQTRLTEGEEVLAGLEWADADLNDVTDKELAEAVAARADEILLAKGTVDVCWSHIHKSFDTIEQAQKDVIAAHAAVEFTTLKKAKAALDDHSQNVADLLVKLRDLDGEEYVSHSEMARKVWSAGSHGIGSQLKASRNSVTVQLQRDVALATTRYAVLEYWLKTGEKPTWRAEGKATQVTHNNIGVTPHRQLRGDEKPGCLYGPDADLPERPERTKAPLPKFGQPTWGSAVTTTA